MTCDKSPIEDGKFLSHEIFMGMKVAAYRAVSRHGEEYGYQFATHWSTIPDHQNPVRLFSENDIKKLHGEVLNYLETFLKGQYHSDIEEAASILRNYKTGLSTKD